MEIVWISMDHNGFSRNVRNPEPVCQNEDVGPALISKQRRQVPRIVRVKGISGIKVTARKNRTTPEKRLDYGPGNSSCHCSTFDPLPDTITVIPSSFR